MELYFPGEATAFALSIGDADDVDRFDAYQRRLYPPIRGHNHPDERNEGDVNDFVQRVQG